MPMIAIDIIQQCCDEILIDGEHGKIVLVYWRKSGDFAGTSLIWGPLSLLSPYSS